MRVFCHVRTWSTEDPPTGCWPIALGSRYSAPGKARRQTPSPPVVHPGRLPWVESSRSPTPVRNPTVRVDGSLAIQLRESLGTCRSRACPATHQGTHLRQFHAIDLDASERRLGEWLKSLDVQARRGVQTCRQQGTSVGRATTSSLPLALGSLEPRS